MRNRYYLRTFLNRPGHHGRAYVLVEVEDTSRSKDEDDLAFIDFEISDCFRRVSLDFPLRTAADRKNSLAKARLLAEVTARFLEALEAEAELAAHRSGRSPANSS